MSEFLYEVGDSFEGGPIEIQKYIGAILAVGGQLKYEGNVVTITGLPGKTEAKPPVVKEVVATPEPVKEEVITVLEPVKEIVQATEEAPVVEEDLGGTDLGTAEIGDKVEEAPAAPKTRGRKPAVKAEEVTE